MKKTKTTYICDRCGCEIDELIFLFEQGKFKKTISATMYEQVKYGYLPDNEVPLPDANCIVLDGVCGYQSKGIAKIHFCRECTRDFKRFMKNK